MTSILRQCGGKWCACETPLILFILGTLVPIHTYVLCWEIEAFWILEPLRYCQIIADEGFGLRNDHTGRTSENRWTFKGTCRRDLIMFYSKLSHFIYSKLSINPLFKCPINQSIHKYTAIYQRLRKHNQMMLDSGNRYVLSTSRWFSLS